MTDLITDGTRLILPSGVDVPCSMGKGGLIAAAEKREGDGATPIGRWRLTHGFYRTDRLDGPPDGPLPMRAITETDGWCDDPADPNYNRLVTRPYPASHETLMRDDRLYDIVVVTDHNSDPPVPGLGSAIFLHCRRPDGGPTAGCIAIEKSVLLETLAVLETPAYLDIRATL